MNGRGLVFLGATIVAGTLIVAQRAGGVPPVWAPTVEFTVLGCVGVAVHAALDHGSAAGPSERGAIRIYRVGIGWRWMMLALGPGAAGMIASLGPPTHWWGAVVWGALGTVISAVFLRHRIETGPDGICAVGLVRRVRRPWADLTLVSPLDNRLGGVVLTFSGSGEILIRPWIAGWRQIAAEARDRTADRPPT